MNCIRPFVTKEGFHVPCGSCIKCRIQRSREWSVRLMHELDAHGSAVFLTLSYDDDHLPADAGLEVEDVKKFFKRVRRGLEEGRKVKYFACGEYGDRTFRPHYHAIVFGLKFDDCGVFRQLLRNNARLYAMEAWPHGSVVAGTVTYDSCRYCADYVLKKLNGKKADIYGGRKPPFLVCSHGIGAGFVEAEADRLKENLSFTARGVRMGLPRYYKAKLGLTTDDFASVAEEARIKDNLKLLSHRPGRWYQDTRAVQSEKNDLARLSMYSRDVGVDRDD